MKALFTAFLRLLRRAAWAPIAVLIFHAIVAETPYRKALDFTMHFSGGAAIAYFSFVALHEFRSLLGMPTAFGRYLFSFALTCTVGMFWEIGEYFSDVFLSTHIQKELTNTMSDLIADAAGALSALALVFLIRRFKKPDREQPHTSEANSSSILKDSL
jgi:hypothetical protein